MPPGTFQPLYMQSDATQTANFYKAWAWFETNKKQVTWGALILAVVALIAWFFLWNQSEKEATASEALSTVSTAQFGMAGAPRETAEAYLKVAANYPKSSAGARALLLAGGSLFVDGKFAEARAQFERFTREHRESPFRPQALLGIAACLDAEGKMNEAISAYKSLKDHYPGENVVSQARFALANLYEAQGKPELAKPEFEEVAREPYGSLSSEAGMRLEELKLKYPNLAPPMPMPTNAMPLIIPSTIPPSNAAPVIVPPGAGAASNTPTLLSPTSPGSNAPIKVEKP